MTQLRIFLLGPPRLERGTQTLTTDTRKALALIAYLAITGEHQTRDALAAFLWPEFDEQHAKAALRRTLSVLKSAVGDDALHITRHTIGLASAETHCDALEFLHLLAGQPAIVELEQAVGLYRDEFMAGFSLRDSIPFDDWQSLTSQHLRRELEAALEKLVNHAIAQQQLERALSHAQQWLTLDPLREETHCLLMELYAGLGQRHNALHQYRECVRILEEELGVTPLAETTRLYHAIRAGHAVATPLPHLPDNPPALQQPFTTTRLPLIGRDPDLAALWQQYKAIGPDGRLLILSGEAGIGKTRLAHTFLAQTEGAVVMRAVCYEGERNLAYQLFEQAIRSTLAQPDSGRRLASVAPHWLAEAAQLVPELADFGATPPAAAALNDAAARSRFFAGIAQVVVALCAAESPGILFIDDLQWADDASLELLAFLVRRLHGQPLFILATWRSAETDTTPHVRQLLTNTERAGLGRQLTLPRLQPDDVAHLVAASRLDAPPELAARLYRETEGLPFVVVEYLAMLASKSHAQDATVDWAMPGSVRDLLQARLTAVTQIGLQILQTSAAIGRAFSFELVQSASGRTEEETITVLEDLVNQGLIQERRDDAMASAPLQPILYDFSHDKLRALVYTDISLGRRRLLHRRLAEALLAQSSQLAQPNALAGQIASHYHLAGQDSAAALHFKHAGDYARGLHAQREALAHYQMAIALGHADAAGLHEACGDLYTLQGAYTDALASYEMAAALAAQSRVAQLEHKLGQVYLRQGKWGLAGQQLALARQSCGPDTAPAMLAALLIDWALTEHRQAQPAAALALTQEAHALAQAAGDLSALAKSYNMLGLLARGRGDSEAAIHYLNDSQRLANETDRVDVQIAALNNLALALWSAGKMTDAQECLQQALHLCQTYGDRHREAALRNNLADLLHLTGAELAAQEQIRQSALIYAEIGRDQDNWQSEIWKLTEW